MAGHTHDRPQPPWPVVRTPESPVARPREFLRTLWRDAVRSRALAVEIAKRDVRSRYRQSLLGASVVLLPPLAITAVALGFRSAGILSVNDVAIPYGLFVLAGVVLWTTFLDALNAPIQGLLAEQRLIARTNAPSEGVVLGKLAQVFVNAALKLVLLAMAIAFYQVTIPATILLAPVGLLGLIALGTAVGLLLAPVNLIYRDVSAILGPITTFWFFVSPVYFPAPPDGVMAAIMRVNPVTPLLSGTRALALTGAPGAPWQGLLVTMAAFAMLGLCWLYVRVTLPVALEQASE